jgi:hypothetical protein
MATMTATSEPPAAARAQATPKASMWMRWTLMPQTWATSRLCETARRALPGRVFCRNQNAAAVIRMATAQAMTRDLEKAKGPTRKEPVRYSTERRSEVNMSWARLTIPMETPKVSSSEDSSGASTTRRTRRRWSTTPTTNSVGIEIRSER